MASCDGIYLGKRLKPGEDTTEPGTCHICKRQTAWFCFGCSRYLCCNQPQRKIKKKKTKKKAKGGRANNKKKKSTTKDKNKHGGAIGKKQRKKSKRQTLYEERAAAKKMKKDKEKMLSKYPGRFVVSLPIINAKSGEVETSDEFGTPSFEARYGEYTCYHIAHLGCWKDICHDETLEAQLIVVRQDEKAKAQRKRVEEESRKPQHSSKRRKSSRRSQPSLSGGR